MKQIGLGVEVTKKHPRPHGGLPANALTLNGQPLTLNGQQLTLGA